MGLSPVNAQVTCKILIQVQLPEVTKCISGLPLPLSLCASKGLNN